MQYDAVQKMRMHDALEKNRTLAVFGMILVAVAFVGVSSVVVVNTEASTSVYRGSKRGKRVVRRPRLAKSDCPTTVGGDRGAALTLDRLE